MHNYAKLKYVWQYVKKLFIITYSHGQELFYKFVSNFTNKLVKQLLSMTVQIGSISKCIVIDFIVSHSMYF